jgi:hypothetical protein
MTCVYCKINDEAPNATHHPACLNDYEYKNVIIARGGRDDEWPQDAAGIFEIYDRFEGYEWVATQTVGKY